MDELITYDSFVASLKFVKAKFRDGWCEGTQTYRVAVRSGNDVIIFEFWEDGTFKSVEEC